MKANFDDKTQTWYVESPIALNTTMKIKVVDFLKKMYSLRITGEMGPRRKRMQEAVSKLTVNSLEVRLVGSGEKVLYLEPGSKL